MPRSSKVSHQSSGLKCSVQASSRAPRRQASSSGGGDAAVAAGQDAFEHAPLDVVALHRHRAELHPGPQVLVRPVEVFASLHAVPLVRRVRLGDEVGDAGRDLGVAAGDVLADPGDRLGHLDDAVEVGGPLAGQAAHEVELDLPPAAAERLGAPS